MLQFGGYRDYAVILHWFYSDFIVIYINICILVFIYTRIYVYVHDVLCGISQQL